MQHRPERQFPDLAADARLLFFSRCVRRRSWPAFCQGKIQFQVCLAAGIDLDRIADQRTEAGKLVGRLIGEARRIVIAPRKWHALDEILILQARYIHRNRGLLAHAHRAEPLLIGVRKQ